MLWVAREQREARRGGGAKETHGGIAIKVRKECEPRGARQLPVSSGEVQCSNRAFFGSQQQPARMCVIVSYHITSIRRKEVAAVFFGITHLCS